MSTSPTDVEESKIPDTPPHLTSDELHKELAGKRLPKWAPLAVGVVAIVIGLAIASTGILGGVAQGVVIGVIVFVVGLTGWSFAVEGRRWAVDRLATTAIYAAFVAAIVPLISILLVVFERGIAAINAEFFTSTMRNVSPRREGGGIFHAFIGTLEQVGVATLIAVPVGIMVAIFLVEYGARGKLATAVSFFVDVMTGVPSIVAGLFIYTCFILTFGFDRSGFAAALSLTILMLPVVVRTTEEMLKLVPMDLREASYALGVPKWLTIIKIVIPTALSGIITGVMLAVARVAGETAPLLLTTFMTQSLNWDVFNGPQAAIPTFVWDQIANGTQPSMDRAWAGALVLIVLVAIIYIAAKLLAARFAPKAK